MAAGRLDWAELVARMQQAAPPPLRGTVLRTGVLAREPAGTITHLWYRPPGDLREADAGGRVRRITTPAGTWQVRDDGVAEWYPRPPDEVLGWSHPLLRPAVAPYGFRRPDDYHQPLGPPAPVEWLGRRAWRVTLAPVPPRKPEPVTLWIDEEFGFLLRAVSGPEPDAPTPPATSIGFLELELSVPLEDRLFRWTGPVDDAWARAQQRRAHAQAAWGGARLPVPRYWPDGLPWELVAADPEQGVWTAELTVGDRTGRPGLVRLDRRPLGAPAYQPRHGVVQVHRWSDGRWQWTLVVEAGRPLAPEELTRVIASIPPEEPGG